MDKQILKDFLSNEISITKKQMERLVFGELWSMLSGRVQGMELVIALLNKEPEVSELTKPLGLDEYQAAVSAGGHSMDRNKPCSACGDLDGCHEPARIALGKK